MATSISSSLVMLASYVRSALGPRPFHRLVGLVTFVVAAAAAAACDKVALTAPKDTTLTLVANATNVPLNAVTELTAILVEPAGTPVQNGTQVTFTTSLGLLDPPEARTQNGKATVRFVAGSVSGLAKIRAFSGLLKAEALIELKVGGSAATRIFLSANPSSVPAVGGSVEILATVLDADGNRVSGIPVSFSTSAGSLSSATVFTDGNGEAKTRLSTTREAIVTASAGTVTAQTLTVKVNAAPTVTIAVEPTSPIAGQSAAFIFALNTGAAGAATIRELFIDFGDGDKLTLQSPSSTIRVAHAYRDEGTYTVTATVTDVNGERSTSTFVIAVQPPTPLNVILNVGGQTGHPENEVEINSSVEFSVTLTPTSDAQRVLAYAWDFGDGQSAVLNSPETNHIYKSFGPKLVTITVTTIDGKRAFAQKIVTVVSDVPE